MTAEGSPANRIHFIDVLRLLALAQMVNGHTLHAVLDDGVRHGEVYQGYIWFRGLVSVAFMLVAGLAYHVTTVARFDAHRADPGAARRRVMRALEIIAIGFLLKLPVSALLSLNTAELSAGLLRLSRIDVLPCIGVSLLMLEGLVALCRKPSQVVMACFGLAALCAVAAPWGASLPVNGAIVFLTGWLGPQGGSMFPLLPYSGYVFAGVVLGAMVLPDGARTPARVPALRLLVSAALLFGVSSLLAHAPWSLSYPPGVAVHRPAFFVTKLAAVVLGVAVLAHALRNVRALPEPLRVLTGETLAIYVFHLQMLYGVPVALHGRFGTTLSLSQALSLSALMLIGSTAVGIGWHRLKRWQPAHRFVPSERLTVLTACVIVCCALLLNVSRALAAAPVNTNGTRYAIAGYDPVAYFEEARPAKGSADHAFQYQGATFLFASEAHRQAFVAQPARFAPAYGGHCAFAAAEGRLVTIDPNAWSIVRGRLFLNYSLAIRAQWNAERDRFIRLADEYWRTLSRAEGARVSAIALTVADLESSRRFFVDTLGFVAEAPPFEHTGGARARSQCLALGDDRIELIQHDPVGRAAPNDARSDDLWFQHLALVASDLDRAHARVQATGASAISAGPQTIPASNRAAGGIRAFYFKGPSSHPLELIWFPPGKGAARWQSRRAAILGIDHTAIAVASTARARSFYEGLGLRVAGRSFNFGPEQEALSGVPGARVRITALRGDVGPGVELLEYESPRRGRPIPTDSLASDLWHAEIVIDVPDLNAALAKLRRAGARFVSDRALDAGAACTPAQGARVLDPDGHAVRLVE